MAGLVLHMRMDSLFSSVEELRHPEHDGKPIVVGASPSAGRGVVSSANKAARKAGVRRGMPVDEASRACPQAVFLPVDFSYYRKVSSRLFRIISAFSPKAEAITIDEFALELEDSDFEPAARIAARISKAVHDAERLGCSIGIGTNRFTAMMALSEAGKRGIGIVRPEDVRERIWPKSVGRLHGVGKKTAKMLSGAGITTIGDLARADINLLIGLLGDAGYDLHKRANGMEERDIQEKEAMSISREQTFGKETNDIDSVMAAVDRLAGDIYREVAASNLSFRTIGIKLRYDDLETHTRSRTLHITNSFDLLKAYSREMVEPFLSANKKVRLVGVRVENLIYNHNQKSLSDF